MRLRPLHSLLPLGLLLAGCAAGPEVDTGVNGRFAEARRLLLTEASKGPVELSIDRAPPALAGDEAVADVVERTLRWSNARVDATAAGAAGPGLRLAYRFARVPSDPAAVCAGRPETVSPMPPEGIGLHAIACDGNMPVADVLARSDKTDRETVERVVQAATDRLFANGGEATGSRFPGTSIFGGVGVGSDSRVGVGVGLGF